jgi:hypothetical protein
VLDIARQEAFGATMVRLQAASGRAVEALLDLLDGDDARFADQVRAPYTSTDIGAENVLIFRSTSQDLAVRASGIGQDAH